MPEIDEVKPTHPSSFHEKQPRIRYEPPKPRVNRGHRRRMDERKDPLVMGYGIPDPDEPTFANLAAIAVYFGRDRDWVARTLYVDLSFPIRRGMSRLSSVTYESWMADWICRRIERQMEVSGRFDDILLALRRAQGLQEHPSPSPWFENYRAIPRPPRGEGIVSGVSGISSAIRRINEGNGLAIQYSKSTVAHRIYDGSVPVAFIGHPKSTKPIPITYPSVLRAFI